MPIHPKFAARQQQQQQGSRLHPSQCFPMDNSSNYHCRSCHHFSEVYQSTHGQCNYPVPPITTLCNMEMEIPNSDAPTLVQQYQPPSMPLFLSDTMMSLSACNPLHTVPQPFFTNPQFGPHSNHAAPSITYYQHHFPPPPLTMSTQMNPNHLPQMSQFQIPPT